MAQLTSLSKFYCQDWITPKYWNVWLTITELSWVFAVWDVSCPVHNCFVESDLLDVALFLMGQVEKSGELHGYKMMHLKCIQSGFVVSQDNVRLLLHIIDPEGIKLRKKNRLRRRTYRRILVVFSTKAVRFFAMCTELCLIFVAFLWKRPDWTHQLILRTLWHCMISCETPYLRISD